MNEIQNLSLLSKQIHTNINKYVRTRDGSPGVFYGLIVYITIMVTLLSLQSNDIFVPLIATLSPALIIISLLYRYSGDPPAKPLIAEFLIYGGLLSISVASILEYIFTSITMNLWKDVMGESVVSAPVELLFVFVVIVTVGGSEEFAKYFPMSRSIYSPVHISQAHWYTRLVDSPNKLVVLACASAAGFATVENIKYVFAMNDSNDWTVLTEVAVLRGVLAVPFHIFCTGLVALLSYPCIWSIFKESNSSTLESSLIPVTTYIISNVTWGQYLMNLAPSSILHGLYDSALMLSSKLPSKPMKHLPLHKFRFLEVLPISLSDEPVDSMLPEDIWGASCLFVAFLSNISTFIMFVKRWKKMIQFQNTIKEELNKRREDHMKHFLEDLKKGLL